MTDWNTVRLLLWVPKMWEQNIIVTHSHWRDWTGFKGRLSVLKDRQGESRSSHFCCFKWGLPSEKKLKNHGRNQNGLTFSLHFTFQKLFCTFLYWNVSVPHKILNDDSSFVVPFNPKLLWRYTGCKSDNLLLRTCFKCATPALLKPTMLSFFNRKICQKVNGRTCASRNVVIHCSNRRKKDEKETNSVEWKEKENLPSYQGTKWD